MRQGIGIMASLMLVMGLFFWGSVESRADVSSGERVDGSGYVLAITGLRFCNFQEESFSSESEFEKSFWSCEARDRFQGWLKVSQVGAQGGALVGLCVGLGAPVSIGLASAAFGMSVIDAVLTVADCDRSMSERQLRAMVNQMVCESMNRKGIACSPDELE